MDNNWNQIGKEIVATVCLGLLLFGVSYNLLVDHFQKRTQHYTAELVVIGVLITVACSGFLIGWIDMLIVLLCFVFAGTPMVVGSWIRNARDEEQARKIQQQVAKDMTK